MLQTKYSLKYVLDIFSPRLPFTNVVIATYNECMFLAMNFGAVFWIIENKTSFLKNGF